MTTQGFFLYIVLVLYSTNCGPFVSGDVAAYEHYYRSLQGAIFEEYDRNIPPMSVSNSLVTVQLGLTLISLREVDEAKNEVETAAWLEQRWTDERLVWMSHGMEDNTTGNSLQVSQLIVSPDRVWKPDITLYNSVQKPEIFTPDEALINADGTVLHAIGMRHRFTCDLAEVSSSQGTNCTLKFAPGIHSNDILVVETYRLGIDFTNYLENPNYEVIGTMAETKVKDYLTRSKISVEFVLNIRKGTRSGLSFWGY